MRAWVAVTGAWKSDIGGGVVCNWSVVGRESGVGGKQ